MTSAGATEKVLTLWADVGNGLDKTQTVVWRSALDSLEHAHAFYLSSSQARIFVAKYMNQMIGILLDQSPHKIGRVEREIVQDSLPLALQIVALDLEMQLEKGGTSGAFKTLGFLFRKNKNYYRNNPELRIGLVQEFLLFRGFERLVHYLRGRLNKPDDFLDIEALEALHVTVVALLDACKYEQQHTPGMHNDLHDLAIDLGHTLLAVLMSLSEEKLVQMQLETVEDDLVLLFDWFSSTRREAAVHFYATWREWARKLLAASASSLLFHVVGWERVSKLIQACKAHRPPPRSFLVQGAGVDICNGEYEFAGSITADGYHAAHGAIKYERRQDGNRLTLFRCTMRSRAKWWFLSTPDEEQPGTDRDIDYYQNKAQPGEERRFPPTNGWTPCRSQHGVEPPPTLQPVDLVVPVGEERNTLEHQLAKWAFREGIVEKVLQGDFVEPMMPHCCRLIEFVLSLSKLDTDAADRESTEAFVVTGSDGDEDVSMVDADQDGSLKASHLLLAWETCTGASRPTQPTQFVRVSRLLVSILPDCPPDLFMPLMEKGIWKTWEGGDASSKEKVIDFCKIVADSAKEENAKTMPEACPHEILKLMWAVFQFDLKKQALRGCISNYISTEMNDPSFCFAHLKKHLLQF